jgi:hypothetical protein
MKYMVSSDKTKCGSTIREAKESNTELLKSPSRKYNQTVAVPCYSSRTKNKAISATQLSEQ